MIASRLRRAGFAVITVLQGSIKKRPEKAKQLGADALLYVREAERFDDRLHLTNVSIPDDLIPRWHLNVLLALPDQYRALEGDDEQRS